MATDLGELIYTLTLNDSGFEGQISTANESIASLGETATGAADTITGSMAEASGAVDEVGAASAGVSGSILSSMAPLIAAFGAYTLVKDALSESNDIQAAQAQIAASLIATKDASGETVDGLNKLADSQEKTTTFSAAQILAAENVGLTYTNIGQNIFPQALQAAENLSSKFGVDLSTAMKTVGKALESPTQGMATLQRYIGVLDPAQKAQIKNMEDAGNVAGAQGVLLDALSTKMGGAASAATDTFGGKMKQLGNEVLTKVSDDINILNTFLDKHITLILDIAQFLLPVIAAILLVIGAIKVWTIVQGILNAITEANPWVLLAMVVVAVAILVISHWSQVRDFMSQVWSDIKSVWSEAESFFKKIGGYILDGLLAPVKLVIDGFNAMIKGLDHIPGVNIPQIPQIPTFATGVQDFSGGLAIVGENGPELVSLPSGSNVYPNGTGPGGSSSGTVNVTLNVGAFMGTDADARNFAEIIQRYTNRYNRMVGTS